MAITLYHAPRSRAFRALWLLEEMGVDYELVPLDLGRNEHKSPEMLALNPMGKVPVVAVDGHAVWESPAIVAHLCDLHPEAGLAPPVRTPARADFYRWLSFAVAVMEPAFTEHMRGGEPAFPASRVGWGDFGAMKRGLAAGLANRDWVLGDAFSGADVLVGGNLHWFTTFAADAFADVPAVAPYVERVRARPAFRRAGEIDAGLAAQQAG
jgi:glutathione S-transferase